MSPRSCPRAVTGNAERSTEENELTTRKEHVARIADKCEVAVSPRQSNCLVYYREQKALYAIGGDRPRYIGEPKDASQMVIDGMRLAAQREIDKLEIGERAYHRVFMQGPIYFATDPAKPGSDKTAYLRPGAFTYAPEMSPAEKLINKIASLARMTLPELAEQYAREIAKVQRAPNDAAKRHAQDMADLIDDIASMRFGVGFYQSA